MKSPLEIKAEKSLTFINDKIIQHFSDIEELSVKQRIWEHKDNETPKLPEDSKAIYSFHLRADLRSLKVGQVGKNSQVRYRYHHYEVKPRIQSSLARSICKRSPVPEVMLTPNDVGEWIKTNTIRIDFFLPGTTPQRVMNILEAALIGEWAPLYEGRADLPR
ncbi:hypothetical protein [Brucella sp. 1315]|uniref:hypothetical protein n=1 Tax=Brucella sp. 1315 TaxID=2975050 RepID=UPI00217EB897|nr:hypothetical protein [Brucella sp. 1315]UWF68417.1 hypothetical protein NYO63_11760 [Brucella sp. 1315]